MNILDKWLGRGALRKPADARMRPTVDGRGVADTIDEALSSAGLARHTGAGRSIRATIDQALAKAGIASTGVVVPQSLRAEVIPPHSPLVAHPPTGAFLQRSYANATGSRDYKLYLPSGYDAHGASMPLVVMLHGCTQSSDDFAAGTRMNALADMQGFLVAYPEQTARANGSKCWNWFRSEDQQPGGGEPSLIAGIARQIASDYHVDPRRVFVAGLSAGAAMAVILGQTHPEVFAAVGAHSGLPHGAAHDMASAFAAMQGRIASNTGVAGTTRPPSVPTIVFHGDRDPTVAVDNGHAITAAAAAGMRATTQRGTAPGGRAYTREVFVDGEGRARVEHWIVHGAGHAWSGGSTHGTYTDPSGPDASAEMIRFFLQQGDAAG